MFPKKTFAAVSALAGAVALFTTAYSPAVAQGIPQGWFKVCSKQQDVDVCNTMNTVVSNTGQPLTSINLVEIKGKQNEKRIGIQVPTGRLIPEGIHLQIGDGAVTKIPYVICNGPTCIANDKLDDKLVDALKKGAAQKGGKLVITTINFRGAPNPIEISLDGFTKAYTGPGMQEKDFQAEQEKIQNAIEAKQKELADRFKAEQEKAKGN